MFSGQNVYIKIHQTEISLSADKIFLAFIFYLISIYLFFYLNGCCCYMIKGQDLANLLWTEYLAVRFRTRAWHFGVFPQLNLLVEKTFEFYFSCRRFNIIKWTFAHVTKWRRRILSTVQKEITGQPWALLDYETRVFSSRNQLAAFTGKWSSSAFGSIAGRRLIIIELKGFLINATAY